MVGPGDVDNDLEPEVKDECNTKYGDVIKVIIHEVILRVLLFSIAYSSMFTKYFRSRVSQKNPFESLWSSNESRVPSRQWWISMDGSSVVDRCELGFTIWKSFTISSCCKGSQDINKNKNTNCSL